MKLQELNDEKNSDHGSCAIDEPRAADISLPAPDIENGLRVVRVSELTLSDRNSMYSLLSEYYLHASRQRFERDLAEKEWVVLGADPITQEAWGFSTLMRLHATIDGHRVLALYSGDTVTRKEYWGGPSTRGVRMLVQLMFSIAESSPTQRVYWFMISSTYKSYRLLPMLFREFHPSPERPRSEVAESVLGELSELKHFAYDPERSVVRFANPTLFREGIADVTGAALNDPYISFYTTQNSGISRGDRLVSLTALSEDNLTTLGQRFVRFRSDAAEQEEINGK